MSTTRFARALPAGRTHLDQLAAPLARALRARPTGWTGGAASSPHALPAGGRLLAVGNGGSAARRST